MNWQLLLKATLETLQMVGLSSLFALLLGLPLSLLLVLTQKGGAWERPLLYRSLDIIINILRSFPFIILIVVLLPLSKLILTRSVGTAASIIPLSIAAAPFVGRLFEQSFNELNSGILEASKAMGCNTKQLIFKVLLPEALPALISGLTLTIINLIAYSAMAGAVGGGGLGDLAIRFGIYSYNPLMQWSAVFVLLVLVQLVQWIGKRVSQACDHR